MRLVILNLFALLLTQNLFAQHEYLTVRQKNGDETSIKVATGTLLTLKNGVMQATTNGQATTFPLSNLQAFFFAATPTGILNIEEKSNVKLNNNTLIVDAPANTLVTVATADGKQVCTFKKSKSGVESQAIALTRGIYIVTVGKTSQKLLVP